MIKYCKTCSQPLPETLEDKLKGIKYHLITECDGEYYITDIGKVFSSKRNNFLKITNKRVTLPVGGTQKSFKIYDLLIKYFDLNKTGSHQPFIEHINGDPFNFSVDNLRVY